MGAKKTQQIGGVMNRSLIVLLIRVALGLLAGWFLSWAFFGGGVLLALILAGMVVAAAYASEGWRNRNKPG